MTTTIFALLLALLAGFGPDSGEVDWFRWDVCYGRLRWQTLEEYNVVGFSAEVNPDMEPLAPYTPGAWSTGFIPASNPGTGGGAFYVTDAPQEFEPSDIILCTWWNNGVRSCDMSAEQVCPSVPTRGSR